MYSYLLTYKLDKQITHTTYKAHLRHITAKLYAKELQATSVDCNKIYITLVGNY